MSTAWNVNKGGPIPSLANVKAANGLVKLQNTTSAVAALTNIKLNKLIKLDIGKFKIRAGDMMF